MVPAVTFEPDRSLQSRGSKLAAFCLAIIGWRVDFQGLPGRQGVIMVYPHTSNWDFPIGLLAKWAIGIQPKFWAKDSLFRIPVFGQWLRWLGGIPLDRKHPRGVVGDTLSTFAQCQTQDTFCWLVVTPEGTRSYTEGFRSGFYQVTLQAQVPLGIFAFDYAQRCIRANTFIRLSGDEDVDYQAFRDLLEGVTGCRPRLAGKIQPLDHLNKPKE